MNKKVGALLAGLLVVIAVLVWLLLQGGGTNTHERVASEATEVQSYETFKADLDARIDGLKENERQFILNTDALAGMAPNAPVYRVILKNTYADLFEVSLTAYFADEEHQICVFAFLNSDSKSGVDAAISPIVMLAEAQAAGTNAPGFLLFSRYRIILEKENMSERAQRSVEAVEKNGETLFTDSGAQFAAADELLFFAEAAGE